MSFGFPYLLVSRDTQSEVTPPENRAPCLEDASLECKAEDVPVANAFAPSAQDIDDVEGILEGDDWDMGDDEIEFVDVETKVKTEAFEDVDIDLTLEEEGDETSGDGRGAVESCPICDTQLIGMSTLVCQCSTSIPLDMAKTQMIGNSRPCGSLHRCHSRACPVGLDTAGSIELEDFAAFVVPTHSSAAHRGYEARSQAGELRR